ncbi:MAG: hypothetical protein K2I80_03255, partial [Ruminococcus sp.]|nr:hypothetical protein [Ruminococcus sp.]
MGNPIDIDTTDADKAIQLLSWDVTEKQQNGLGNTVPCNLSFTESCAENTPPNANEPSSMHF